MRAGQQLEQDYREYVHEWTGEVAQEEDVGAVIGNAIADYRTKSGKAIWGMYYFRSGGECLGFD
jgi:hypothetical protein